MLLKIVDRLEETIIAVLMAVATLVIFVAVVHRYASGWAIPGVQDWLLSMDFSWAQEFCTILFVWMAKFGAAYGVRTGIHVGVDVVVGKFTGKARVFAVQLGLACGVFFTFLLMYYGSTFIWKNGMAYDVLHWIGHGEDGYFEGTFTPDLEWPTWMVYAAVPLGSALMCFRFIQVMIGFARTGHLPSHNHSHVEGLEEEMMIVGEAVEIAEDIEHDPTLRARPNGGAGGDKQNQNNGREG